MGWFGEFPHIENSILVLAVNCCIYKHYANYVSKFCWFVDILLSKSKKCAVQKLLDICFLRFKWKIANIFARLWKSAQSCHWAIFPSSAANFRPADRWNRKSQIIRKLCGILKFKPQQCYKLIKTLLQTENEGKLGFELWPRFADFARFFCAFALKDVVTDYKYWWTNCERWINLISLNSLKISSQLFVAAGDIFKSWIKTITRFFHRFK